MKKICKKCNIEKDINCFTKINDKYYVNKCVECKNIEQRDKWREKHGGIKKFIEKKKKQEIKHYCFGCSVEIFKTIFTNSKGYKEKKFLKYCPDCFSRKVWRKKKEPEPVKTFDHIKTEFVPRIGVKAWDNPDVLYISKRIEKLVPGKLVINLCKWCRAEITYKNTSDSLFEKGYCSEWCEEIDNPPLPHKTCIHCGNALIAYTYKSGKRKGQSTGMYGKSCEECVQSRLLIKKTKI